MVEIETSGARLSSTVLNRIGKSPILFSMTKRSSNCGLSLGQLAAIPLSCSASNIIVSPSALSAITKKINQHTASETSLGDTTLQETLLRAVASVSDQSRQMQQLATSAMNTTT